MNALNFPEANKVFVAAPGDEDSVKPLCVWKGPDESNSAIVLSCWEPTEEEIQYILEHKKVWLWVNTTIWDEKQPPVFVEARYPFKDVHPNPDYVEEETKNAES